MNANCVTWLQVVLLDRFGVEFVIRSDQQTVLGIAESERYIEIQQNFTVYNIKNSEIPCTHWNSESEGYTSPIANIMPVPGLHQLPERLIEETEHGYRINFDILSFAIWMMSQHEATVNPTRDQHQRFPAIASHAFRHDYLERPLVDEWLVVLGEVIKKTWPGLTLRSHDFSIEVSHDVDLPSAYMFKNWDSILRISASHLLRHGRCRESINALAIRMASKNRLNTRDPANTFDWILRNSQKNSIKNAFYFISGGTNRLYDADYTIEHKAIRHLLNDIHQQGHEIGLHPSYDTFLNQKLFLRQAEKLKAVCSEENIHQEKWGGRMHYLRWSQPETAYLWEQAKMDYDSTAGFPDRAGFKCGTCFEFPAIDPTNFAMLNLRIKPLIAMEVSILSEDYMGIQSMEDAFNKFSKLKDMCRKVNGRFSLLWHNSELITDEHKELYQQIVAH